MKTKMTKKRRNTQPTDCLCVATMQPMIKAAQINETHKTVTNGVCFSRVRFANNIKHRISMEITRVKTFFCTASEKTKKEKGIHFSLIHDLNPMIRLLVSRANFLVKNINFHSKLNTWNVGPRKKWSEVLGQRPVSMSPLFFPVSLHSDWQQIT